LTAPADKPFQIVFDNQEAALHNVAIYRDASAAEKVLVEEPFSGPAVVTYEVPALGAGTYFFRCDVHPDMRGNLTVG
jgi:plastocyanin